MGLGLQGLGFGVKSRGSWRGGVPGKCLFPPALMGGANRLFQLPGFVPQAAGFRRARVQIKVRKKDDLIPNGGQEVALRWVQGAQPFLSLSLSVSLSLSLYPSLCFSLSLCLSLSLKTLPRRPPCMRPSPPRHSLSQVAVHLQGSLVSTRFCRYKAALHPHGAYKVYGLEKWRRPLALANLRNVPQKWQAPPWKVTSCRWTQRSLLHREVREIREE